MSKQEFEAILNAKAEAAKHQPQSPIDWNAQKEKWISALAKFYEQMDAWLSEYVSAGKIKVEQSQIEIEEEHIGKYAVEARLLRIGEDQVVFRPIGTLLIGAHGRVDMEGPKGVVKFILTGKHSNGIRISVTIRGEEKKPVASGHTPEQPDELVWKIATPPPKVKFIELNPDTFFDSITEVLNG